MSKDAYPLPSSTGIKEYYSILEMTRKDVKFLGHIVS